MKVYVKNIIIIVILLIVSFSCLKIFDNKLEDIGVCVDIKVVCKECNTNIKGNYCIDCGNSNFVIYSDSYCTECHKDRSGTYCNECGTKLGYKYEIDSLPYTLNEIQNLSLACMVSGIVFVISLFCLIAILLHIICLHFFDNAEEITDIKDNCTEDN